MRFTEPTPDSAKVATFAYVVLALVGLGLGLYVIGEFDTGAVASFLGAGVAASLVASGLSGLFTMWIVAPQTAKSVEQTLKETLGWPAHIQPERKHLNSDFLELSEGARRVDIISLSLSSFFDNTPQATLLDWIAEGKKQIRLLVLSPDSEVARYRGREEGIDLGNKIRESINKALRFYEFADSERTSGRRILGSLELRSYDAIPYFAYLRCDDLASLGLYYSHVPGIQSEALRVEKGEGEVFLKARAHFEKLWEGSGKTNTGEICTVSGSGMSFSSEFGSPSKPVKPDEVDGSVVVRG